jgi:hypothetical protein
MLEKDIFTDRRLDQLKCNPELLSTEKWGKYCCVPLDIPRYEYPELVKWYFEKAKPIYKLKSDIANPEYGMTNFDSVDVFVTGKIENHIWTVNPQQDFLKLFPEVLERILKDFPFKSVDRINLWSSHKGVRFHRDHTKFIDYPSSFRIMLYDTNPVQTLGLAERLPDQPDTDSFLKFPVPRIADTNSVVWNNLRIKHGSFFIQSFRKIILIIDKYELDVDRYHDLMERSINKYQKELIISNNSLTDFVNI